MNPVGSQDPPWGRGGRRGGVTGTRRADRGVSLLQRPGLDPAGSPRAAPTCPGASPPSPGKGPSLPKSKRARAAGVAGRAPPRKASARPAPRSAGTRLGARPSTRDPRSRPGLECASSSEWRRNAGDGSGGPCLPPQPSLGEPLLLEPLCPELRWPRRPLGDT
ncbi:unnamed protein product [Rangifer tarandus platyrhynchus]|uniref:Uncharacterized protein n=1 Tax=Rangifer tarandus platyrhynchus TaxID=3082113 RepID=A0ACB1MJS3_RANTA